MQVVSGEWSRPLTTHHSPLTTHPQSSFGEYPSILAAATLRAVHHQAAFRQGHARQCAGYNGDLFAAENKRPKVHVTALEMVIHKGRMLRKGNRRLGDVIARPGANELAELRALLGRRSRTNEHAVAARFIHRLDDELFQV